MRGVQVFNRHIYLLAAGGQELCNLFWSSTDGRLEGVSGAVALLQSICPECVDVFLPFSKQA